MASLIHLKCQQCKRKMKIVCFRICTLANHMRCRFSCICQSVYLLLLMRAIYMCAGLACAFAYDLRMLHFLNDTAVFFCHAGSFSHLLLLAWRLKANYRMGNMMGRGGLCACDMQVHRFSVFLQCECVLFSCLIIHLHAIEWGHLWDLYIHVSFVSCARLCEWECSAEGLNAPVPARAHP